MLCECFGVLREFSRGLLSHAAWMEDGTISNVMFLWEFYMLSYLNGYELDRIFHNEPFKRILSILLIRKSFNEKNIPHFYILSPFSSPLVTN